MRALFLAAGLVAATATSARADEVVVGLLDLRGDGVDEDTLSRFAEAVEDGLGGLDWTVAPRERMQEMLASTAWTPACAVGPCLAEVRAQTGADYVVNAGLAASGMSYRFTVTLLSTRTGDVIEQKNESCPACTVDDVIGSATIATIALINDAGVGEAPAPASVPVERVHRLERRVRDHAALARRTGVLLLGAALLAGAGGYYFHDQGRDGVGYPLLGAAGGLALSGALVLGISLRF